LLLVPQNHSSSAKRTSVFWSASVRSFICPDQTGVINNVAFRFFFSLHQFSILKS
jgi:hypothetical protein